MVAADGSGDYRSVQECFDALPSKPATWRTVEIKAGEYREKVTLDVYKDKVHIVGHDGATIVWVFSMHSCRRSSVMKPSVSCA